MSRKKLVKQLIKSAVTAAVSDVPPDISAIQQFAAVKKARLSPGEGAPEPATTIPRGMPAEPLDTNENSEDGITPFWKRLYNLECHLNKKLQDIPVPSGITHIYNPIEYAANLHCAYLKKYLDGPKRLLFVGMNPGPNGMGQTGIPFGNILTVRDEMGIFGHVTQPPIVHPKRLILGLECGIEEPSGVRIWTLMKKLAGGSLDVFSRNCFLHNFCPLIFYDKAGRNITPSELKGDYKTKIGQVCLDTLDEEIDILQPQIVVAIGAYVAGILKHSRHVGVVKILKLHHPSPRALNNQNWPETAEQLLQQLDLIKYIRNN